MFFQTTNSGLKLSSDAALSLLSFQASQWHNSFLSGNRIKVIGVYNFGGDFRATFCVDENAQGFETFILPDHWVDLGSVFLVNTFATLLTTTS